MKPYPTIAVIGAGLSGIACARRLSRQGFFPVVFEKSRSLSGRCATRLWEGHVADHGVQYFTVRCSGFRMALRDLSPGDIHALEFPILHPDGSVMEEKRGPRLYHLRGNNRLGRELAGGLDIRFQHTLQMVSREGEQWSLGFEGGSRESFDRVVLTAPWPQSAALLGMDAALCDYRPCLTGLFACEGLFAGNSREVYGRLGDKQDPLAWSACENHKLGRVKGSCTVFVAQASMDFSQEWLEAPIEVWLQKLQASVGERWKIAADGFVASFGHRWRYARNLRSLAPPPLPSGLYLAGDSLAASRVEDAWLSGEHIAEKVIEEWASTI